MRRATERQTERHPGPALAWAAAFVGCVFVDAALGRWIFLPLFVAAFYAGMVVIDLVAYPLLERWRAWLRPRGARAWYLAEVGGLWIGTSVILALLAPWWLEWGWSGLFPVRVAGAILLVLSIGVGVLALWRMGWARILFAAAMFPPGSGEEGIPQRLVVTGPYRYVRNPLYVTDVGVMVGAFMVTGRWFLIAVLVAYLLQLGMQIYFEERELKERFGEPYLRYLRLVPRFFPRTRPVDAREIHGDGP
jgi:protein-S-isoprenylcysteine O-methyltransferase Ste14